MYKTFLIVLLFSISISSYSQKKDVSIKEFYSDKSLNLILIDLEIAYNLDIEYEKDLLKGITIGANSIIGAGSVVTHDIPPNSVAVGNPCKVIMTLNDYYLKRKEVHLEEAKKYAYKLY